MKGRSLVNRVRWIQMWSQKLSIMFQRKFVTHKPNMPVTSRRFEIEAWTVRLYFKKSKTLSKIPHRGIKRCNKIANLTLNKLYLILNKFIGKFLLGTDLGNNRDCKRKYPLFIHIAQSILERAWNCRNNLKLNTKILYPPEWNSNYTFVIKKIQWILIEEFSWSILNIQRFVGCKM